MGGGLLQGFGSAFGQLSDSFGGGGGGGGGGSGGPYQGGPATGGEGSGGTGGGGQAGSGGLFGIAGGPIGTSGPAISTGAPVTINVPIIGGSQRAPLYLNGVYGTPENGGSGVGLGFTPPIKQAVPANYGGAFSSWDTEADSMDPRYQQAGFIDLQVGGTRGAVIDASAIALAGGVVVLGFFVLKRFGIL